MAETHGLVQSIKLDRDFSIVFWVDIGPSPTDTTLMSVEFGEDPQDPTDLPSSRSLVEALTGAMFARREVIVFHGENDSEIRALRVVPG